jgi:DNA mismatch repair protein MutS
VFNVSVAEEDGEVVFLRRVVPGAADRSYGIQVARLAGLPSTVTVRAEQILRDLEAGRGGDVPARSERTFQPVFQLQLDGFDLPHTRAAGLLAELLALDVSTMTPLEALNQLSEVQRRAGRL